MFKTELTLPLRALGAAVVLTFCAEASVTYSRIQIASSMVKDLGNVSVYGGRGVSQAFNGSGMSADWTTHVNNSGNNYWMMNAGPTSVACALIPLPADSNRIDRIVIFGCNWLNGANDLSSRSVKAFSVWYGDAEVASAVEVREKYTKVDLGVDELPQPVGAPANYTGVTFDLPQQISAKYLAVLPTSGYDNTYISVGEVVLYEKFVISDGKAELENLGLLKTADGQLAVTGTVRDAAAFVGYAATADGGKTWYGRLTDEPVAADEAFSVPVVTNGWEQYQYYSFYSVAENDAGASTNFLKTAFVGVLPADRTVWLATDDSSGQASDADSWSQGVPTEGGPTVLLDGRVSNRDIRWAMGAGELSATYLPPMETVGYGGSFFLDIPAPGPVLFALGDLPFEVPNFHLGSVSGWSKLILSNGLWSVSNEFVFGTSIIKGGAQLTLEKGAQLEVGKMTCGGSGEWVRSNTSIRVTHDSSLVVKGAYTSTTGYQRTALVVEGLATFGSVTIGSNANDFHVVGGVVTNAGDLVLNQWGVGAGAHVSVTDGGRFVQRGAALFDGGPHGDNLEPGFLTLSRGGVFEIGGAFQIGSLVRRHPDNINVLTLADAETRLTAPSLTVADTRVLVKLPVGSAGESCVTIAGTASFVGASCVEIDLAGAASGRYEILSAGSLEGLTPENVTLVGRLPPRHSARLVLTDRRLTVVVTRPGLSVLLR